MTTQNVDHLEHGQALQAARYAFLAKPPPTKKRAAHSPPVVVTFPSSTLNSPPSPPLRRRASAISAWAALVQPGSPAPRSPHRTPSSRRSSSITRRRPSLSSRSHPPPLGSFTHPIATTTPTTASIQDIDINLSALGYTSVFVHLPKTPLSSSSDLRSPRPPPMLKAQVHPPSPKKPTTGTKKTILKRFRSLGLLRPHSKPQPHSPPSPLPPSPVRVVPLPSPTKIVSTRRANSMRKARAADHIARRKRAKYAHLLGRGGGGGGGGGGPRASKNVRPPPTLASEIALMQFMGGGSLESNVKRMMEEQARAAVAAGSNHNKTECAVGDVYRDDQGGLWWDKDEEMEYKHLLGGEEDEDGDIDAGQWIKFEGNKPNVGGVVQTGLMDLAADCAQDPKRDSLSTQDSDLDVRYIVLPADETRCGVDNSVPASPHIANSQTGLSVPSLQTSRPQRKARHLMKSELLIDLDLIAFAPPRSPGTQLHGASPKSPRTPPKSARFSSTFILSTSGEKKKPKKARRRPAPLKLHGASSSSSMWRRVEVSPVIIAAEGRREFVEASFMPLSGAVPSRRKIVYASLDPMEDEEDEDMHSALRKMLATNIDVDIDIDVSLSKCTGSVARRKRTALRGLSERT